VKSIQGLVTGCDAGKRTALLNMLEEYDLQPIIASNVEETRQIIERGVLRSPVARRRFSRNLLPGQGQQT
jgi:hypothetical protein